MKRSMCLSIFLFLFSLLHAQEKLGRKPWFGAQFASNDEGKKTGCLVTRIGGGTSEALKLQNYKGIILNTNEKKSYTLF